MKTIVALAMVLGIDLFLFLGNYAIADISGNQTTILDYNNDFMTKFDSGGYVLNETITGSFPSGEGSISPETGNLFTDTFSAIKNWFLQTTGLDYLLAIVNAVPNFLKRFLDPVLAFALGVFWHALTIFLIVNFIKGGE